MENKYYTPSIEEFRVGFEYELKSGFGDGVVKTTEDFIKADWSKRIATMNTLPYVERALNGKNRIDDLCGVRVKFLDKVDIESLGYMETGNDVDYFMKGDIHIWKVDGQWCIQDLAKTQSFGDLHIRHTMFKGNLKNKSELIDQLKRCGIEI